MKLYCEFYHLSTGYIEGSIPPQFSEDNRRPIPMCGSDSYMVLDARKNVSNLIIDCKKRMNQLGSIGFKIISANSLLDKGRILYSHLEKY